RIIDEDDPLTFEIGAIGVVFEADAEMADLIGRLDKGTADIMVADDTELEGEAGFGGVAEGRGHAGIGHRHDNVRFDRRFPRQFATDALARLIDAVSLDDAVRTREVDVLENAEPGRHIGKRPDAPDPAGADDDDLAGIDVAHEIGAEDVARARPGGDDPAASAPAERQRAHPQRVPQPDDLVL